MTANKLSFYGITTTCRPRFSSEHDCIASEDVNLSTCNTAVDFQIKRHLNLLLQLLLTHYWQNKASWVRHLSSTVARAHQAASTAWVTSWSCPHIATQRSPLSLLISDCLKRKSIPNVSTFRLAAAVGKHWLKRTFINATRNDFFMTVCVETATPDLHLPLDI